MLVGLLALPKITVTVRSGGVLSLSTALNIISQYGGLPTPSYFNMSLLLICIAYNLSYQVCIKYIATKCKRNFMYKPFLNQLDT